MSFTLNEPTHIQNLLGIIKLSGFKTPSFNLIISKQNWKLFFDEIDDGNGFGFVFTIPPSAFTQYEALETPFAVSIMNSTILRSLVPLRKSVKKLRFEFSELKEEELKLQLIAGFEIFQYCFRSTEDIKELNSTLTLLLKSTQFTQLTLFSLNSTSLKFVENLRNSSSTWKFGDENILIETNGASKTFIRILGTEVDYVNEQISDSTMVIFPPFKLTLIRNFLSSFAFTKNIKFDFHLEVVNESVMKAVLVNGNEGEICFSFLVDIELQLKSQVKEEVKEEIIVNPHQASQGFSLESHQEEHIHSQSTVFNRIMQMNRIQLKKNLMNE